MIFDLVRDFAELLTALPAAHPRHRLLALLAEAVRRDVHLLGPHPTTLFQCLWNSCWWYDGAGSQALRLQTEGWRRAKGRDTPGFVWVRALRRPAVPLGTALRLVLRGHRDDVRGLAWSRDGRRLASGSGDGTVRVWDADSGRELLCLRGHTRGHAGVGFGAGDRRLVSADGGEVRVWEAGTGELLAVYPAPGRCIEAVAFSPDGRRLAVALDEPVVRVWDLETGRELFRLVGHETPTEGWVRGAVHCVAFSPDGRSLATGADDLTVRLWDALSGAPIETFPVAHLPPTGVAFSADGRRLAAAADQTVRVWDLRSRRQVRHVQAADGGGGGASRSVAAVAYSGDSHLLAAGGDDGTVRLFNAATYGPENTYRGHQAAVRVVAFSPDGRQVASAGDDRTVRVWDVAGPGEPEAASDHTDVVCALAFAPDGSAAASGGRDGTACVWDVPAGALRHRLPCHSRSVPVGVAFSPDSARLATCVGDSVRVWDAGAGQPLVSIGGHEEGLVTCVAFSPDGRLLASGGSPRYPPPNKGIRLWDAETGGLVRVLAWPDGGVEDLAFSATGKWLAAGGAGKRVYERSGERVEGGRGVVRVYEAETGRRLASLDDDPESGVVAVAFAPDGRRLITRSAAGVVRVWDLRAGKCAETISGLSDPWSVGFSLARAPAWVATTLPLETAFRRDGTGKPAAWYPGAPERKACDAAATTWALAFGAHLQFVRLETESRPFEGSGWYYTIDLQRVTGPVPAAELRKLIESGGLPPEALVSRDHMQWHPARKIKGARWPGTGDAGEQGAAR